MGLDNVREEHREYSTDGHTESARVMSDEGPCRNVGNDIEPLPSNLLHCG